ncbi:MAG TPA: cysteine desulfurase-like protein [Thermoanaerobaculia bacterium]|nr:cysteine desulfurase-like protein [Thermoanaerobaculia bacterium]
MSTTTSSASAGAPESARGAGVADVAAIRARFPALERRQEALPVAYFDGPGGTQVPREVAEAMTDYLYRHNANTHWHYPSSAETDAAIEAARHALADYVNGAPEEVAFGANMTSLTYHLSRALGRGWGPGDEIVVTELDHHANSDPWRALAVERGVTVRAVPLDPATGELVPGALAEAVSKKTRLVAIGAASNALGTINDVRAACALARSAGALSFVDAVHFAAHAAPDVRAIGCDFLACSPYKFYGPHLGVLWARREIIDALDVPRLEPAPDWAPERLETGTLSHEGIVGAAAAVDFLAGLAGAGPGASRRTALESTFETLRERGRALFRRLWDGLGAIPGVTRYGPPPGRPRTDTVSFVVAGRGAHAVAEELARRAVFASSGDFYALTVVRRLGHEADGLVRAGIAAYTTGEEVDRLLQGVGAAASAPS